MQQGMWCTASAVHLTVEEEDALALLKAASRNPPRWHLRRNFHWFVTAPLAIGYALMALQGDSLSTLVAPALSAIALAIVWAFRPDLSRRVLSVARSHPALITRLDCRGEGDARTCTVTLAGMVPFSVADGDAAEHVYAELAERIVRAAHGPVSIRTHLADANA